MNNQSTINLRLLCWIYLHWVHLLNTPLHWSASSEHREKAELQLKLNTKVLPPMARLKEINICIGCICQASLHCVYKGSNVWFLRLPDWEGVCICTDSICYVSLLWLFSTLLSVSLFFVSKVWLFSTVLSVICYLCVSSLWAKFVSTLCTKWVSSE